MIKRFSAILVAFLMLLSPIAFGAADDICRLYTFSSGTTIQSSQVNQEVNQLITTMNAKFGRDVANTLTGNNTFTGENTFTGTNIFSNATTPLKTDKILEYTSAGGVTIDGLLIKDGILRPTVSSDPTPTKGDFWFNSTSNVLKYYDGSTTYTLATTVGVNSWPKGYMSGAPVQYVSASTVKIPSGVQVRNSTDTENIQFDADANCVLSTSGAGGLDTGSEASGSWYNVYAIEDIDTQTEACLLSLTNEAASGTITLPSGYDVKRQLPIAIRNDGSSNIIPFYVAEGWPSRPKIIYAVLMAGYTSTVGATNVIDGGTSSTYTSFTDVSLASLVPPISQIALLKVDGFGNTYSIAIRPNGYTTDDYYSRRVPTGTNNMTMDTVTMQTDSSQIVEFKTNTADGVDLAVLGYIVTEVR